MDLPALVIDGTDVTMASCIAQLRAMASGLESGLDMTDVRVDYVIRVEFRKVEPPIGRIDPDGRWDISDRD